MKRTTGSVTKQYGLQRCHKSRTFVFWGTGLRAASQVSFEESCGQQSRRQVIGRSLILCWSLTMSRSVW